MSVHRPFDASEPARNGRPHQTFRQYYSSSQQLTECLAGGLQRVYQTDPEAESSDAFADLIARLRLAEDSAR